MIKAILLSSIAINVGLILGRLTGFVRESFVALNFGTTSQADIVVLMLTVPDLLVNILMGGALGAVLIPEFYQHSEQARKILYQALMFFGTVFLLITLLLYWQIDSLILLLVPGFSSEQIEQAVTAVSWVIWLIPLTVLAGVTTAYLQAKNKFAIAALGTLIINSSIITGLVLVYLGYGSLKLIAGFVLLGGLLRLLSQLYQVGIYWNPFSSWSPLLLHKKLLSRYTQAVLSGSVLLLFPVLARAIASYEGSGSVAIFNYAMRLIDFPLAIAVTFLVAVLFPRLSDTYMTNLRQHRQLVQYGVQAIIGLAVIASLTLIIMSDVYTELVYGYGNMQKNDLLKVEALINIGLISLPFQGLCLYLTAVFNSHKNTRLPMLLNISGLLFYFIGIKFDFFGQGMEALMMGLVISYALICALQIMLLRIDKLRWKTVFFDKMFALGLIIAILVLFCLNWIAGLADLPAVISFLLAGATAIIALGIMILFNAELRNKMKAKLSLS